MTKLYFLDVVVVPQREGMDIVLFVSKLGALVVPYSNITRIVHKFKVTGEPQILAIVDVFDVVGLERMIAGLYRLGSVTVTCTPLYEYEKFGKFLGAVGQIPDSLPDEDLYWLEFSVEQPGKGLDNVLEVWQKEATNLFQAGMGGCPFVLYKFVMQQKVQCFVSVTNAAQLDELYSRLPLMVGNGEYVTIKCKAVQKLETFRQKLIG